MDNYLKIGELANMTGVTIRTLHYYDEVDLLKPVEITETGHRLYDLKSITELYRIISMKDLGFNLDEIKDLIKTKDIDVHKLVDIQLSGIQEEIAHKQLLLTKLLKLKQNLKDNNYVSSEDFQKIVPFINASADQFFTKEQFDKLKNHQSLNNESEIASDWMAFILKLENCYKNKLPKTDTDAIDCISYWREITTHFIGDDKQMEKSILSFHSTQESNQLKYGLTDELYQYLMSLMD